VGHYRKFALAHHPASSERVLSANREKGKTYHAYWNRNRRSFQHFRQRVRNAEHSATPKIGLPMFANRRLLCGHQRVVELLVSPPVDLMVGTQTCDEALQFDCFNSAGDGSCDLG
jgi:hypothetical protein